MNKHILPDVAVVIDDSDVAEPVNCVRLIEGAFGSDQLLLQFSAFDLKWKDLSG
jgi:hypothetical protein